MVTFISQVSPDFQGEAQVFRAELDMGPKSKQECTERDAGACSQSWSFSIAVALKCVLSLLWPIPLLSSIPFSSSSKAQTSFGLVILF